MFQDDEYPFCRSLESSNKSNLKTHIFHFKGSNEDYEQIITGAYQIDLKNNELCFAFSRYRKRTKAYLRKLIDVLDPLALDYLEKKEKLEREMHTQKTWRRELYTERAKSRLALRPLRTEIPIKKDKLCSQDYRDLEKYMLKQFKTRGLYTK